MKQKQIQKIHSVLSRTTLQHLIQRKWKTCKKVKSDRTNNPLALENKGSLSMWLLAFGPYGNLWRQGFGSEQDMHEPIEGHGHTRFPHWQRLSGKMIIEESFFGH